MFLGFVLATTAMQTNQKASTAVAVLIPGIALGLPIMDTLLAIGRRAVRGRPLFQPDKEHIHHKLMDLGLSHRQSVLVLYGFCIVLGAVAMVLTYSNSLQAALLLVVLMLVAFFFLRSLGYVRFARIQGSAVDRKRNRAMRAALQPLGRQVRQIRTPAQMWPVIVEAATALGAVAVSLQIDPQQQTAETPVPTFIHGPSDDDVSTPLFRYRFTVPSGKTVVRTLELGWSDGRGEIDRDIEIAAEIFCEHLGEALDTAQNLALSSVPAPTAVPRR
jgi:UDP-GlcNAc:undecaprenyl-phosphate GlcNAc-1-phosphate transferase